MLPLTTEPFVADKQDGKILQQDTSSIIGKGAFIEGDILTKGNIRIEGKVKGNINTNLKLVLGKSSYVEGNLLAQNAEIAGEIKGKVRVHDLLVLKDFAVVHGDIVTNKLVIEAGAFFNGKSKMSESLTDTITKESREIYTVQSK